jgi:glycosyltransferase involved in cell wall biosynthesis
MPRPTSYVRSNDPDVPASAREGSRPTVSILCFSPFQRDARVLRQARHLASAFDVTVFAYDWRGMPAPEGVTLCPLARPNPGTTARRARRAAGLALGLLGARGAYESVYWSYPLYEEAYRALRELPCDLLVGNDWNALPIVARVAEERDTPFVIDLHEDAPGEWEHRLSWRLFRRPVIDHALRRHGARADAAVTVSHHIAELYHSRYGWRPMVLRNVPEPVAPPPFRPCDPSQVRLVHHGAGAAVRGLEEMMRAVVEAGPRFHLDLYLVGDEGYITSLRRWASAQGEGRIRVHDPVAPDQIVPTIARYDLGLYILPPVVPQHLYALPNKLFDFLSAGLAVCIGPSPEMAAELKLWDAGFVAPDFSAHAMAQLLRGLSADEIDQARRGARRAATSLSATKEHKPLLAAARSLVSSAR